MHVSCSAPKTLAVIVPYNAVFLVIIGHLHVRLSTEQASATITISASSGQRCLAILPPSLRKI